MKNKKLFIIILLLILFFASLLGYFYFKSKNKKVDTTKITNTSQTIEEKSYLLDGYPLEAVPLFKNKMVSASKFFVNDDPANSGGYFSKPVSYYNVVFETEATPAELLSYYRSLMSEVNEESVSSELLEGKIGKYKVSASHYGNNPKNYAYLQVYLPSEEYQKTNPYYDNYPSIVELESLGTEYESSYGLLNQKGGEIEYTQYFPMPKDNEERDALIKTYQEKYQQEIEYSFDEKSGLMRWKKDVFSINMTFSRNHGRIYLMIRKPM
jgi:hypothetical protein